MKLNGKKGLVELKCIIHKTGKKQNTNSHPAQMVEQEIPPEECGCSHGISPGYNIVPQLTRVNWGLDSTLAFSIITFMDSDIFRIVSLRAVIVERTSRAVLGTMWPEKAAHWWVAKQVSTKVQSPQMSLTPPTSAWASSEKHEYKFDI